MSELNLDEIKAHHERTVAAEGDQLTVSEHERGLLLAEVEKLNGALAIAQGMLGASRRQVEEATASVVSLSGQCDRLTARCAQMERDHAETVAEVERLRAERVELSDTLNATMLRFEEYVEDNGLIEQERDALRTAGKAVIRQRDEAIADRDRARDIAVALEQENAKLRDTEEHLRDLHSPIEITFGDEGSGSAVTVCAECDRIAQGVDDENASPVFYPCPTINALDGEQP